MSEPDILSSLPDIFSYDPARGADHAGRLPFTGEDTTAGSESEFQTVVTGAKDRVDLAIVIESSNYFKNIVRRAAAGETPRRAITALEQYLNDNPGQAWENSWARFPLDALNPFARELFRRDLRADKNDPSSPPRGDADRFFIRGEGEERARVPVSYLLKLALADVIGAPDAPELARRAGDAVLARFSNDNTSPEITSFTIARVTPSHGMGMAAARENGSRYLMTQLLVEYANRKFRLKALGQEVGLYYAPLPPTRQKKLNEFVSDSFYRDLFLSPCLSGWDRGEDKFRYMALCHQTLSRSQLNALGKLKDAGIITRNLVTLPNMSTISLANNGVHVSLGSRMLTGMRAAGDAGFTPAVEKRLGDLVIKIVEHFLPLFAGTYSAAPCRLDFADFHPERALGFLPHELDYTHLRMLWRRWKKKARLTVFGQPITPFGPAWLDRAAAALFNLKGDLVPDFRLLSYLVSLMSTGESSALDGSLGNDARLKKDLADMGVFDESMALYLLYRQRTHATMGYCGFEGRHYSLFPSLTSDLGGAVGVQALVTALAVKYAVSGAVTHAMIPDDPFVESERRQVFFGSAIGVPTFYVAENTPNMFLRRILPLARGTRRSARYPGYLRVHTKEYRHALRALIEADGPELMEMFNLRPELDRLRAMLDDPQTLSAAGRLTAGALKEAGAASALSLSADEFNTASERHYRGALRSSHLAEALELFLDEARELDSCAACPGGRYRLPALGERRPSSLAAESGGRFLRGAATQEEIARLIHLILLSVWREMERQQAPGEPETICHDLLPAASAASVY